MTKDNDVMKHEGLHCDTFDASKAEAVAMEILEVLNKHDANIVTGVYALVSVITGVVAGENFRNIGHEYMQKYILEWSRQVYEDERPRH